MGRTAKDLADEAASVIETCALSPKELRTYLAAWLADCARDGDLDRMRADRNALALAHDSAMREGSR